VAFRFTLIVAAFCVLSAGLQAQTIRGAIGGFVTDPSGKAVPSARVDLTQVETGRTRATITTPQGSFLFALLAPGEYRVDIDRDGFRKHVEQVNLLVNQEVRLDVPLLVGARADEVSVSAPSAMTRTDSAAVTGVIDSRQIRGLPLDGRNFYELALLLPGVAPPARGSAGSARGDFAINVNGAREDGNSFLLDGVYNGDAKLNGFAVQPPVDAIREFEVATSSYDASFGRNGGGQVNVVLRSGSNAVHGSLYEFFRNTNMDARNFFAPEREKYNRNQFGGVIGAPIVRNRTFVFADYEGRRVREGIPSVTNVPTLAERRGDFSQSLIPAIDPTTGQPLTGGVLPSFFLNPVGVAVANLFPAPNRNVAGANYVSAPTQRDRNDHFDVRVDHLLSTKSELTARYSFGDRDLFTPFSGPTYALVPGYGVNIPRRGQNAMLSSRRRSSMRREWRSTAYRSGRSNRIRARTSTRPSGCQRSRGIRATPV